MENQHKLSWVVRPFQHLSNEALYAVLKLRAEVFIIEQQCNFLDPDNKDQHSLHVMGYLDGKMVAYSRIVPPGLSYEYPAIGRILVAQEGRGLRWGVELMHVSIAELEKWYGQVPIRIGAQAHLEKFYGSFGFVKSSDVYLEDKIEHIEMTRSGRA